MFLLGLNAIGLSPVGQIGGWEQLQSVLLTSKTKVGHRLSNNNVWVKLLEIPCLSVSLHALWKAHHTLIFVSLKDKSLMSLLLYQGILPGSKTAFSST